MSFLFKLKYITLKDPMVYNRFLFIVTCVLVVFFASCKKKDPVPDIPTPPPLPPYNSIQLEASSFTLGNLEKNILDSFVLHYNKPVSVSHIMLLGLCLPDLKWTSVDSGKIIKFYGLLCGRLGEDYSFEVKVHDIEGKTSMDTVNFSYYYRKFATQGEIMNYMISDDNNYVWVCTNSPDRIYRFGIADSNDKKVFDLNFKPFKIVLNPYNQKFYVLNYPHYNTNVDKVFVMDPVSGQIERSITVNKDRYDDPQKQIKVYDLAFGANGYGVINTGTVEYSSSGRWRIIDSRYNDTIYAHPEWVNSIGGGPGPYYEVVSLQPNYNKSKIYMRFPYAMPRAAVMDVTNGTLSLLVYPDTNPNHYLVPSKTTDQLFIASYAYQAIVGPRSSQNYSQFDDRYSETADFSYRTGESNIMYYRSRDYEYNFNILDYKEARIRMTTNVGPNFNKISATTDGKYILAVNNNGLTLFQTKWFYTYAD
ncbi:MAG TPA: hypothetical protein VNT20_20355 [Flavisolibacter sp.]|nr:hypothetical protein [Flavisolibacter sp.]